MTKLVKVVKREKKKEKKSDINIVFWLHKIKLTVIKSRILLINNKLN